MKRNMDLIREILLKLEKNCNDVCYYTLDLNEFQLNREEVLGHCKLIIDRGLADGQFVSNGVTFRALTWEGHDFLDNSRNSTVWAAAKEAAGDLSFGIFVKVLVETATRYALSKIPVF